MSNQSRNSRLLYLPLALTVIGVAFMGFWLNRPDTTVSPPGPQESRLLTESKPAPEPVTRSPAESPFANDTFPASDSPTVVDTSAGKRIGPAEARLFLAQVPERSDAEKQSAIAAQQSDNGVTINIPMDSALGDLKMPWEHGIDGMKGLTENFIPFESDAVLGVSCNAQHTSVVVSHIGGFGPDGPTTVRVIIGHGSGRLMRLPESHGWRIGYVHDLHSPDDVAPLIQAMRNARYIVIEQLDARFLVRSGRYGRFSLRGFDRLASSVAATCRWQ